MFTDEEKKLIHILLSNTVFKTHEAEQAMIALSVVKKIEAEQKIEKGTE